ncbi:MAG: hypothetical protein KC776_01885 [Myxococcales bacterium]|nr:hypothetical protein [Myxococcales bacterium]MCB9579500.1 hypothetical protein [Polyangiaceae bacterium]
MRVKGTAYHARLNLLRSKWGEEKVAAFLKGFHERHPSFPRKVLATTWMPADEFLKLNDAIVDEVYDGDDESLWELGEASAAWTLKDGPYKNLLETRDTRRFANLAKVMYANFFDTGSARSDYQPERVDLWIEGIPDGLQHLYFEYSVVGYFRRGLELLGETVRSECVEGFSKGDPRVFYKLHLGS